MCIALVNTLRWTNNYWVLGAGVVSECKFQILVEKHGGSGLMSQLTTGSRGSLSEKFARKLRFDVCGNCCPTNKRQIPYKMSTIHSIFPELTSAIPAQVHEPLMEKKHNQICHPSTQPSYACET